MAIAVTNIGAGAGIWPDSIAIAVAAPVPVGSLICIGVCDSSATFGGTPNDGGRNVYNLLDADTFNDSSGTASGYTAFFYSVTTTALLSIDAGMLGGGPDLISYGVRDQAAMTAFYLTGAATANVPTAGGTPFQKQTPSSRFTRTARGSSTTPSVTLLSAAIDPGTLTIAIVGTNGPSEDTFTQDHTNASYVTPPTRVGVSGGIATIAGGIVLRTGSDEATISYAPTLGTSRPWGAVILTANPQLVTGVQAIGAVSALIPILGSYGFITGVAATGAVTAPTTFVQTTVAVTGAVATGQVGAVTGETNDSATLTGISAMGAVGLVDTTLMRGVSATGAVGILLIHSTGHGVSDGDYTGYDQRGRYAPREQPGELQVDDQRARYLAWRDLEWRKRQAQKGILSNEPNIVPDVLPVAPEPATPKLKPVPVRVPDRVVEQWQQQMASAHPLVPAAPVAPFAVAPPAPGLPLPQLSSQLELLRRQMKIKI